MHCISAKFVPQIFIAAGKGDHVIASELLGWVNVMLDLANVIMRDESWVDGYDPEAKM